MTPTHPRFSSHLQPTFATKHPPPSEKHINRTLCLSAQAKEQPKDPVVTSSADSAPGLGPPGYPIVER